MKGYYQKVLDKVALDLVNNYILQICDKHTAHVHKA